jgi:lipoprotein NlpI
MTRTSVQTIAVALFIFNPISADEAEVKTLVDQAREAVVQGKTDKAIESLAKAIEVTPDDIDLFVARGDLYASVRRHTEAVTDFDRALKARPNSGSLLFRRGAARFKAGNVTGSIEDWDRQIKLEPRAEKSHWQRGIAYYYAGEFKKGQRQFELYQTYDDNDVENVVWRFLCQARVDGVEPARKAMLAVRLDRRVPMMQIYNLYRGKATVEDVFAAAKAGEPSDRILHHRLFYAHQYVGLYYEALGNAEKARHHTLESDQRQIGHYMWDVAHVHAARFKAEKK